MICVVTLDQFDHMPDLGCRHGTIKVPFFFVNQAERPRSLNGLLIYVCSNLLLFEMGQIG